MSPSSKLKIEVPLSPGASYAMRDSNFRDASKKSFAKAVQQFGAENLG
jgi:hypothetical protein